MKQESRIAKMAAAAGVELEEVRARAQRLLASPSDPDREARLREIAERVASKEYVVDGMAVVEAALAGDERVLGSEERAAAPPEILRDL